MCLKCKSHIPFWACKDENALVFGEPEMAEVRIVSEGRSISQFGAELFAGVHRSIESATS